MACAWALGRLGAAGLKLTTQELHSCTAATPSRDGEGVAGLLGSAWFGVYHTEPMGSHLTVCVGMLGHRATLSRLSRSGVRGGSARIRRGASIQLQATEASSTSSSGAAAMSASTSAARRWSSLGAFTLRNVRRLPALAATTARSSANTNP